MTCFKSSGSVYRPGVRESEWGEGGVVVSLFFIDCLIVQFPMALSCTLRLKCDGTRAETRFRLLAKRTSPFKSAEGVSSVDYWQPRCAHQR